MLTINDLERIKEAIDLVHTGLNKIEITISSGKCIIYRAGTIIRIDIKGVFDDYKH